MAEENINLLFIQLVIQDKQMDIISLGKFKNLVSDTFEKNPEFAILSIDILEIAI